MVAVVVFWKRFSEISSTADQSSAAWASSSADYPLAYAWISIWRQDVDPSTQQSVVGRLLEMDDSLADDSFSAEFQAG